MAVWNNNSFSAFLEPALLARRGFVGGASGTIITKTYIREKTVARSTEVRK